MVTRDQIHELAQFEDPSACALSFYFQPATPRNKAHKEDAIVAKDLARETLRRLEAQGRSDSARADLERMVRLAHEWRANGVRSKAVFACAAQNFWREYDLPAQLSATELNADRHFRLKPLAQLLGAFPRLAIVLLDRHRARLFDLRLGELTEREDFFHPLSRRGRSDGFRGYDGGHAERRVADEAREHFKHLADIVKDGLEKGVFEKWILGCQDTHWPQFSQQLHSHASQKLLGRFSAEVGHIGREQVRSEAERVYSEWQSRRRGEVVRETINQARQNGRGVTGLRRVLRSLELGEVQTLLVGQKYHAQAVECAGCGHLDAHLVNSCPVCGRETRQVVDVGEAILPWVIRHDIELFYVNGDPEFDQVGNIAALLRFRADSGKVRSISDASSSQRVGREALPEPRYRGAVGR